MSRIDTQTGERRRRKSETMMGYRQRLAVDEDQLDRVNFEYRWVNDDPGRVHTLTTKDDWEPVVDRSGQTKPDGVDLGAGVAIMSGSGKSVLLRKPKVYADADQAELQKRIDDTERAMKGAKAGADETYTSNANGSPLSVTTEKKP